MATKMTGVGGVTKTTELLIVTANELGAFARISAPLAKKGINVECFTAYEWNGEAAFRLVTNNNKKAREILEGEGHRIQENTSVLWTTENTPGRLSTVTTAMAEARINTHCAYGTTPIDAMTTRVVFTTDDADRTVEVLKRLR